MAQNTKLLEAAYPNVFLTQYPGDFIKSKQRLKLQTSDLYTHGGRRVLQSSKLLQECRELRLVGCELDKRRERYNHRMKQFAERNKILKKNREELNKRMAKFADFIDNNDLKRNLALAKRAMVKEEAEKAAVEMIRIRKEVQNHISMLEELKKQIKKIEKYKDFLRVFVANSPADLFQAGPGDPIHSLIQRYEGLLSTKQKLEERNNHAQEDLHMKMKELEEMKQSFNIEHVSYNQQISNLQKLSEDLKEKIETLEYLFIEGTLNYRVFESDVRGMLMSIDNMKEGCDQRSLKVSSSSSYYLKLDAIEAFISNWKMYLKKPSNKSLINETSIPISNSIKLPSIKQHQKIFTKTVVFND